MSNGKLMILLVLQNNDDEDAIPYPVIVSHEGASFGVIKEAYKKKYPDATITSYHNDYNIDTFRVQQTTTLVAITK